MNTRKITLLALALCVLASFPSCQHIVYAADMANLNRRYARGEITKKEYAKQKAHFDFERSLAGPLITAGFTGPNQQARTSPDLQPAIPPLTALPGTYTYTPAPEYVYVQGPAHHPGGGYTPQPQQVYVQGPAHNPGGGYTPQPQQVYVQNPQRVPSDVYTHQADTVYIQSPNQVTRGGDYTPEKTQQYVNNERQSASSAPSNERVPVMRYKAVSEMTAKEKGEFEAEKPKPGVIPNPGPEIAKRQGEKYDAAVQEVPWYLKWQYMFAKGATEDAFPLIKGAEKVNEMRDSQKRR